MKAKWGAASVLPYSTPLILDKETTTAHHTSTQENLTHLMFQKVFPVFSMWIIQRWEGVNDIFLSGVFWVFFFVYLFKKFINTYFLIQRKTRSNEYDSVISDSDGKTFWYLVPDMFWKGILSMPAQMFPEIKFGSLNLM